MLGLTDEEILLRLKSGESSFVERKTVNDLNDCLKTVVAFANSTPIGYPALLFVGVKDNGEPDAAVADLDRIQRRLADLIGQAYPEIYTTTKVLRENGKEFLAIVVPGSERRPHFAGQAFVREGSRSVRASESQFGKLITERSQKSHEILKWKGRSVTLAQVGHQYMLHGTTQWSPSKQIMVTVSDCGLHWVTLESVTTAGDAVCYPLSVIELNFDHLRKRLELRLLEGPIPSWPITL